MDTPPPPARSARPSTPCATPAWPRHLPLRSTRPAASATLAGGAASPLAAELVTPAAAALLMGAGPVWAAGLAVAAAAFAALGFVTRGPAEYLPSVVRAHLAHPPAESHEGYAHRARELALAARLAG